VHRDGGESSDSVADHAHLDADVVREAKLSHTVGTFRGIDRSEWLPLQRALLRVEAELLKAEVVGTDGFVHRTATQRAADALVRLTQSLPTSSLRS